MATVTIQMDDTLRHEAEAFFEGLGLDMPGAMNLFVRETLARREIPFEIAPESPSARLARSIDHFKRGKVVEKTMEELEAMASA